MRSIPYVRSLWRGMVTRPERVAVALLVLVAALELLVIQEYTASSGEVMSSYVRFRYAARRMVLNVSAVLLVLAVLPRVVFYCLLALQVLGLGTLIAFAYHFDTPLNWIVISKQWREGLAFADDGMSMVPWGTILVLVAVASLMGILRHWAHRCGFDRHGHGRLAVTAGVVYLSVAIVLAGVYKPISKLMRDRTPEYAYGYLVAWVAEGVSYSSRGLRHIAVAVARRQTSDRMADVEASWTWPDRVAVIQVESLDWDTLTARVEGQPVMPFLDGLRRESIVYAVEAPHETGSAEADFTVLTALMPNGIVVPYMVDGFPYRNTLPELAQQRGYHCVSLHGFGGNFFRRQSAYEQMGFDEILFSTELEERGCPMVETTGCGGVGSLRRSVADADLLEFAGNLLCEARCPTLHFIITFTSHGPFDRLKPAERELFAEPTSRSEHYLNSMRYVDRALEAYVQAVPDRTLLIVYGDHAATVNIRAWQSDTLDRANHVPWLVYQKGNNLAHRQTPRGDSLARSGDLNMLDMATHLHRGVEYVEVASRQRP